ncbi:COX15/CtaA family protein [Synechococcus sp. CBW1002]|nr:COX15/CtaA family protein [Synechococcus sp. CBW1002]CAK6699943.1 Heme A synthase [Synechococcus sp. CBW1107]
MAPRRDSLITSLALLLSHLVVALVALVAIGGATRVMEAGLACPDWPLCYGVLLPGQQMNMQVFLEWFHRLDAFLVGVALLVLCAISLLRRRLLPAWLPWFSAAALLMVAVQGALGALTVTRLLASDIVTAHLATALALVALMSAGYQRLAAPAESPPIWFRVLSSLALVLVFAQCVLGGSMASQWAADRCFSAGDACRWLLAHRIGAYPAAAAVLAMAIGSLTLPRRCRHLQGLALGATALVAAQVVLGILTLSQQLQVPGLTVAHQLVAALLVAVLAAILGRSAVPSSVADAPAACGIPNPSLSAKVAHG